MSNEFKSYWACPACGCSELVRAWARADIEQPLRRPRVMVIEDLMDTRPHWFTDDDPIERAYRSTQE